MKPMIVYEAISDNGNKSVRRGDKIYVGRDYSLHNVFTGLILNNWTWNADIYEFEVEESKEHIVRSYAGKEIIYRVK